MQCTAVLHLPCKASFFLWLRQGLTSVPLVLRLSSSAVPRLCQLLTFCYCRLLNAVTRVVFYPNGRLTMTFSKPFYHMQRADYYENHEGAQHCRKPLGRRSVGSKISIVIIIYTFVTFTVSNIDFHELPRRILE